MYCKGCSKKIKILKIFGKNYKTKDGTGIRDYIHVVDLAEGHVAMLKNNRMKPGLKIYNFGTGKGKSVLEVLKEFQTQTGVSILFKFVKKREGDVAKSYCSPKKAFKELNWKAKYDLKEAMLDIKKTLQCKHFMKNFFITGTAGFIGFHLAKLLLKQGFKVHGYDSINDYYDGNLKIARQNILLKDKNFSTSKSLLEDNDKITQVVDKFEPKRSLINLSNNN